MDIPAHHVMMKPECFYTSPETRWMAGKTCELHDLMLFKRQNKVLKLRRNTLRPSFCTTTKFSDNGKTGATR
jgi:hypothetical protein